MKRDVLIYFDLITSLKTTQEVDRLTTELDSLILTFFKSEKVSLEKALTSVSGNNAKIIADTLLKNKIDFNDKTVTEEFFKTLKELLKKLKVIKLTLAIDPPLKTIERIHDFIKQNIGVGYILDIEISDEILGGAIVMFDGKYSDFSLQKELETTFKDKSMEILKLMQ